MTTLYDGTVESLAKQVTSSHPFVSDNRWPLLNNALHTAIAEWLAHQEEPCDCCGHAIGAGDHINCIHF